MMRADLCRKAPAPLVKSPVRRERVGYVAVVTGKYQNVEPCTIELYNCTCSTHMSYPVIIYDS